MSINICYHWTVWKQRHLLHRSSCAQLSYWAFPTVYSIRHLTFCLFSAEEVKNNFTETKIKHKSLRPSCIPLSNNTSMHFSDTKVTTETNCDPAPAFYYCIPKWQSRKNKHLGLWCRWMSKHLSPNESYSLLRRAFTGQTTLLKTTFICKSNERCGVCLIHNSH